MPYPKSFSGNIGSHSKGLHSTKLFQSVANTQDVYNVAGLNTTTLSGCTRY